MPLSNLFRSAADTCPFCQRKAGIIARAHRDCQETFQADWTDMVAIATDAARTHNFDGKTLRLSLAEIAQRSYGDGATVNEALEEGWKQGGSPLHGRRHPHPGRRDPALRVPGPGSP